MNFALVFRNGRMGSASKDAIINVDSQNKNTIQCVCIKDARISISDVESQSAKSMS